MFQADGKAPAVAFPGCSLISVLWKRLARGVVPPSIPPPQFGLCAYAGGGVGLASTYRSRLTIGSSSGFPPFGKPPTRKATASAAF